MTSVERQIAAENLYAAMDKLADALPDGFSIEIKIRGGCVDVSVTRNETCEFFLGAVGEEFEGGRVSLSDCIRQGLDWAREQDGGE